MSKKYTCSAVIGVFLLLQGCSTFSPKEDTSLTMDGLKVMTMVNKRDRGEDYIISSSWKLAKKGRIRHSMQYKEKRKNYGDEGDFIYKSVIRYIDPPRYYGTAILTWNYLFVCNNPVVVRRGPSLPICSTLLPNRILVLQTI
ncbi:MAG: hypothetical protein JRJ00_17025 [Deltaproteobacteria bacterium]|nr:hypothetical protein [Deltaproteobacteria bacterium]